MVRLLKGTYLGSEDVVAMADERISYFLKGSMSLFFLMCEIIHGHRMTGTSSLVLIRIVTVTVRLHQPRFCVQYSVCDSIQNASRDAYPIK